MSTFTCRAACSEGRQARLCLKRHGVKRAALLVSIFELVGSRNFIFKFGIFLFSPDTGYDFLRSSPFKGEWGIRGSRSFRYKSVALTHDSNLDRRIVNKYQRLILLKSISTIKSLCSISIWAIVSEAVC